MLENKLDKSRFVRVDSDIVEKLIPKADAKKVDLSASQIDILTGMFRSSLPKIEKAELMVNFEALSAEAAPIVITQSEYMRRMKEMAAMQPGMSFYGELPDSYNLIVNTESPVIKRIVEAADNDVADKVAPINAAISEFNDSIKAINDQVTDHKPTDQQRDSLDKLTKEVEAKRAEETSLLADYARTQPLVSQVIDLALLANGMLKGEALDSFINRTVSLL